MTSPAALLLADARTPSGSHAHSGGLEAAVADGLTAAAVPAYIRARLATVGLCEAALAAAAVGAGEDLEELLRLDAEATARCPTPALRAAARVLGRALLRTGSVLYPGSATLPRYRAASAETPRPVALGVVAAAAGLSRREAALVSLHEDATTVASAAVKLLPVDAAAASAWVAALGGELAALAERAAAAPELPSQAAPLIELRSLNDQPRRLFAS